jgi:thioesterase domain-containing protein
VPIQPHGSAPPLFCVPGNGGNVMYFHDLARHMGNHQPFYGLQAVGLDGKTKPHDRVEEMADFFVREIKKVQRTGPYLLAGHSFGSWIAFEMGQQLQKQGHEVAQLYVLDTPAPVTYENLSLGFRDNAELMVSIAEVVERMFGKKLGIKHEHLKHMDANQQLTYFEQCLNEKKVFPFDPGSGQIRGLVQVYKAQCEAEYTPQPSTPTRITLIKANDRENGGIIQQAVQELKNPAMGWERFAEGRVTIRLVAGDHIGMMREPHVEQLAALLSSSILRVGKTTKMVH